VTEAELQSDILDLARRCNWLAFHVRDSRKSTGPGFPDLVLVHKTTGRVIWAELKDEKGRVSAKQAEWLAALQAGGHTAGVWRPRHWHAGLIQNALLAERAVA
jgi:hypothetical protein